MAANSPTLRSILKRFALYEAFVNAWSAQIRFGSLYKNVMTFELGCPRKLIMSPYPSLAMNWVCRFSYADHALLTPIPDQVDIQRVVNHPTRGFFLRVVC